ncbi:hypothetical protein DES40_0254 [Litorimonas taeanensis]|uniref:Outer membrane beta-barrel porin/alpha-amylase n=1 Tax=Litorimonas taeanensis TaxID=568099 RepID=A0A420WIX1_9PROT|nr:transporter [Litorimonas taeanensis]RKQ70947.1 hypothetical protein DES40_0254 [Litorimonas taeanensis]
MKKLSLLLGAACLLSTPFAVSAHEMDSTAPHAMDHAPIGVMADHRHKKGEFMVSYRYMTMDMDGNRDGTNSLSSETIATTIANPFFGQPMQPPTLRVVPENMKMDMHMVGAMYGLSDRITLMGMTSYLKNDMDHTTFQGGMGTNVLGEFTTKSKGFGDSTIGAIIGLDDGSKTSRQINLNLGLSLPTGSIEETDDILTPMGMTPTVRLPYPMQLGTGTYDLKSNVTYFDRSGKVGWGGQTSLRLPLGKNDEGYRKGNQLQGTAWVSYEPAYWLSFSGRIKATAQRAISGQDSAIVAPVQTADPFNHGGEQVEALFGVNLAGQTGALRGHRLALEVGLPVYRNLNGPQLETDSTVTLGWQKAF